MHGLRKEARGFLKNRIYCRSRYRALRVMPGLVPGIPVLRPTSKEGVDGRDKPGHDEVGSLR